MLPRIMIYFYRRLFLYIKLFWYHIVFFSFPTLEESYYTNLGITYFELEHYIKSIANFKKSEDCNSGKDNTYLKYNAYYLGYAYLNIGNHLQAVKYFEKYLAFEPKAAEVLAFVGWCNLLIYNHEAALKNYLQLVDLEPNNPIYRIESAKILFEINRKEEAYKQLELTKKLKYGVVLELLAESMKYRFNNELENAVLFLEQTIKEVSDNKKSILYQNIGDFYILLSEYKKESRDLGGTISVLEELCEMTHDDFWSINCLAFEYADQNIKLEKALAQINRCLKYQPENSFFMDTKGWILFKMSCMEEAKKLIEKSLELNPNAKETQAHYRVIKDQLRL